MVRFRFLMVCFLLVLAIFAAKASMAAEESVKPAGENVGAITGLPLPRYVSLRSGSVYVRTGPGMRYPVKWVYQRKNWPVEVIQEFDTWRKISDMDGEEGWVHQSLVYSQRNVIVQGDKPVTLMRRPDPESRALAQFEPGVLAHLEKCEGAWCSVEHDEFEGWLPKTSLWGVYEHEESD